MKTSAGIFVFLFYSFSSYTLSRATEVPASWLPGETVEQHDSRMAWWREAKYGMFIHWGIFSIPADGESRMRYHTQAVADYAKYAAEFNPAKFDADEWVSLAHDAGMKYLVFTTKHHDGFAMFRSAASSFNVFDATPYKRDVVKELAAACASRGVRFGEYYSFVTDWSHKGGGAGCPHWDPAAQDGDMRDYVKNIAMPQLRELLTQYGPISVMWFDTDGARGITADEDAKVVEMLRKQPQIIVNPRLAGVKGDFATPEQNIPALPLPGDWELCGTVNNSWGYTRTPAKSLDKLLPYMVTAWGGGGNVLMNVGPTPEGIIPPDAAQRLREVGAWLRINGESIYGSTRGPYAYLPWGTATRRRQVIYLHVFQWPANGTLKVPLSNTVTKAWLLADQKRSPLRIGHENGRIILSVPLKAPDPVVSVIAIQFVGEPVTDYVSVALNKPVTASADPNSARFANDGDSGTFWRNPEKNGWLEFDLGKPTTFCTLRLQQRDFGTGATINSFTLEFKAGNQWKTIFSGEKDQSGYCLIRDFPPVTAQFVRLQILDASKPAQISDFELYPPL